MWLCACRVRPGASSGASRSGLRKWSREFSAARRPSLDASFSRSVVLWTASVEPIPTGRHMAFLTVGVFYDGGSAAGAAILYLLSSPDIGVHP